MPDSIYPAIVPGLRVRHRETLEERTVGAVSNDRVYFQGRLVWSWLRHLWDEHEPLPQPGDRVRVVRTEHKHTVKCKGREGTLTEVLPGGEYAACGANGFRHEGPLFDFEVILPEESETNMTDNETVAVPVELLNKWAILARGNAHVEQAREIERYLPKPKPRLVAVTHEQWHSSMEDDEFDAQPGLLETLDDVIDDAPFLSEDDKDSLKRRNRRALGVTDE